MSSSLNKVTLIGNVGNDPETHNFQNGGSVTNLSLATSEDWKDRDGNKQSRKQWHKIVIFNEAIAEIVNRYVKNGSQIYIEGQLEHRSYDKDGQTHYASEVVLRPYNGEIKLLGKPPERPELQQKQGAKGPRPSPR